MQRNTPGMVLRAINNHIPTMDELKLPNVLRELSMTKRGLILFVGVPRPVSLPLWRR